MKYLIGNSAIIIIFFLFCTVLPSEAQRKCLTTQYHQQMQRAGAQVSDKAFERWLTEQRSKKLPLGTEQTAEDTIKIPVVVHVIHNGEQIGEGTNISSSQVKSQIAVLNEDFQRNNADTVDTPPIFKAVAGSMLIQFVLAKSDPFGNPTNGIVRKQGSETSWPTSLDDELKATSYWPAEDYLNIWVADLSPSSSLGYAQFPDIDIPGLENEPTENRLTDGVVIDYQVFGSSSKGTFPNMRIPYDKGRTTTHEVGHYLGLRHIWGDQGGCNGNDYVDDTPTQESDYQSCPVHPVSSCGSEDMFQNYMDFTDDQCMNLFTAGQVTRMKYVLDNAVRRTSLINAPGIFPPDGSYYELQLLAVNKPPIISCELNQYPDILIRNGGTKPITEVQVKLSIDRKVYFDKAIEIDTLVSGEQMNLTLPVVSLFEGKYNMNVNVNIPGEQDENIFNNSLAKEFILDTRFEVAPYLADFNKDTITDTKWVVINDDDGFTWSIRNVTGDEFNNRSAFLNSFEYKVRGARDWLISPVIDLSVSDAASMRFDISYAENPGYMDTLLVMVSDQCGDDFKEIYREPGNAFAATVDKEFWEPESEDDWRSVNLDLDEYAGLSKVRLAFVLINGYGNNTYIDDVNIFITPESGIVDISKNDILVFPNPSSEATTNLTFNLTEKQNIDLSVMNSSGNVLLERSLENVLNQTIEIDLPGVVSGVYYIRVRGNTINRSKKLVLIR